MYTNRSARRYYLQSQVCACGCDYISMLGYVKVEYASTHCMAGYVQMLVFLPHLVRLSQSADKNLKGWIVWPNHLKVGCWDGIIKLGSSLFLDHIPNSMYGLEETARGKTQSLLARDNMLNDAPVTQHCYLNPVRPATTNKPNIHLAVENVENVQEHGYLTPKPLACTGPDSCRPCLRDSYIRTCLTTANLHTIPRQQKLRQTMASRLVHLFDLSCSVCSISLSLCALPQRISRNLNWLNWNLFKFSSRLQKKRSSHPCIANFEYSLFHANSAISEIRKIWWVGVFLGGKEIANIL